MAGRLRTVKRLSLLLFAPLLASCSAYAGLMPYHYDGEKLTADEAAVAAYQEQREIIGKEKEAFYPASFPEYFTRDPLPYAEKVPRGLAPHSENGEVWIGADVLQVGEKLPPGRYVIVPLEYQEGGNLIIREKGEVVFEEVLFSYATTAVEVNLYEGQSVQLIGGEFAIAFAHPDPTYSRYEQKGEDFFFSSGIWKVAHHLPAGKYRLKEVEAGMAGTPFLYIIAPDGTYRLHQLAAGVGGEPVPEIVLDLHEGDSLYIGQTNRLVLTRE